MGLLLARAKYRKHFSTNHVRFCKSSLIVSFQYLFCTKTSEKHMRLKKDYEKFLCGKTIDNTIYKTDALKRLGGFPRLPKSLEIDTTLAHKVALAGYEWKVDYSVKSAHLRKGLKDELAHRYWYGSCWKEQDPWIKPVLLRFLFSPFRGLDIAIKKRAPQTIYIYPLLRFYMLKGVIERRN